MSTSYMAGSVTAALAGGVLLTVMSLSSHADRKRSGLDNLSKEMPPGDHPSFVFQLAVRDDPRILCRDREFDKAHYNEHATSTPPIVLAAVAALLVSDCGYLSTVPS
jgi:hypothetical protein